MNNFYVNIPVLKQCVKLVQDQRGLSEEDAKQLVASIFDGGAGKDEIKRIYNGDLSGIPQAKKLPEKKPTTKQRKKTTKPERVKGETVAGEIVPSDDLPDNIYESIKSIIEPWAADNNIEDLCKAGALQWGACCMFIGQWIKANRIIVDEYRTAHEGGKVYSGKKLEALLYVWAYFCQLYKKVPLVHDFMYFAGVSRQYFHDYDGRGLTSSSVRILEKAREIERRGLVSDVSDGKTNPVGKIFLLKAEHGLVETARVEHVATTAGSTATALPVFNGGLLESAENTTKSSK